MLQGRHRFTNRNHRQCVNRFQGHFIVRHFILQIESIEASEYTFPAQLGCLGFLFGSHQLCLEHPTQFLVGQLLLKNARDLLQRKANFLQREDTVE